MKAPRQPLQREFEFDLWSFNPYLKQQIIILFRKKLMNYNHVKK